MISNVMWMVLRELAKFYEIKISMILLLVPCWLFMFLRGLYDMILVWLNELYDVISEDATIDMSNCNDWMWKDLYERQYDIAWLICLSEWCRKWNMTWNE